MTKTSRLTTNSFFNEISDFIRSITSDNGTSIVKALNYNVIFSDIMRTTHDIHYFRNIIVQMIKYYKLYSTLWHQQ